MALEDFTTYTLAGADAGLITIVDANTLQWAFAREHDARIYKDFGVGFFDPANEDVVLEFELELQTTTSSSAPYPGVSVQDELVSLDNVTGHCFYLEIYSRLFGSSIIESGSYSGSRAAANTMPQGVTRYMTSRSEKATGKFIAEAWSDQDRTVLVERVERVQAGPFPAMRYLMPINNWVASGTVNPTWEMRNLEIISPAVTPPAAPKNPLLFGQDF